MQMANTFASDVISLSELKCLNTQKKKKFTNCEIEVLKTELEAGKYVLFGGLSSGINKQSRRSGKLSLVP